MLGDIPIRVPAPQMKERAIRVRQELVEGFLKAKKPIPLRYLLQAATVSPADQRKAFQLISRGFLVVSGDGKRLENTGPNQTPPLASFKKLEMTFVARLQDQDLRVAATFGPVIAANVTNNDATQTTTVTFDPPVDLLLIDRPPTFPGSRKQRLTALTVSADEMSYVLFDVDMKVSRRLILDFRSPLTMIGNVLTSVAKKVLPLMPLLLAFLLVPGCVNHGSAVPTPPMMSPMGKPHPSAFTQCATDKVPAAHVVVLETYSPISPVCADTGGTKANIVSVQNVADDSWIKGERVVTCLSTPMLPPAGWHIVPDSAHYNSQQCFGGNPNMAVNNAVIIEKD